LAAADQRSEWAKQHRVKRGTRGELGPLEPARALPFFDHPSVWRDQEGGWLLVLQPYQFSVGDMNALTELCEGHGFDARVDPAANWHDPNVVGVVIRAAGRKQGSGRPVR
jgi:hypothetical protein